MHTAREEGTFMSSFFVWGPAGDTEYFVSEMSQTKFKVMLAIPTL